MATPLICRYCNGHNRMVEENEQRFENAFLRSELETLNCFTTILNSSRNLFPAANAYSVAIILSLKEVVSLAKIGTPMWTSNERLNINEYYSNFFPWYAKNVPRFVHEVSRASALVTVDASSLVTNLMNYACWQKIFPTIIADVSMESGHSKMINVDFMPQISPLIRTWNVKFFRCSKHIENDTWVIADISSYLSSYPRHQPPKFMRFPSGYLVQHIADGVSKVTIIDHWVYKEEEVINHFNSGFGAQRWLTALQRHFYNTSFISIPSIGHHVQIFDPICHTNLLNLSAHMVHLFCTGVCGITAQKWKLLGTFGSPVNNIRMFTRECRDMSGAPCALVSATGLARMQAKPEIIFDLINRARKQDIWNYIQSVREMKEMIRIKRSPNLENEVTVFSVEINGPNVWCLIQETYYEASEAMIIHSWVEASSFAAVINSGDLSRVEISLNGFTIVPCGQQGCVVSAGYQGMADQAMVTSSDERVVNSLKKMVTDTLRNVQNVLPVS